MPEQDAPQRPEWLWDLDHFPVWTEELQEARAYIEHLEAENKDLKRRCKNLKKACHDFVSSNEEQAEERIRLGAEIERLKAEHCEKCKRIPWSRGQMNKCEECPEYESADEFAMTDSCSGNCPSPAEELREGEQ